MAVNVTKYSKRIKKIPPDGGYGWAIVAAFAICYVRKSLSIYNKEIAHFIFFIIIPYGDVGLIV